MFYKIRLCPLSNQALIIQLLLIVMKVSIYITLINSIFVDRMTTVGVKL